MHIIGDEYLGNKTLALDLTGSQIEKLFQTLPDLVYIFDLKSHKLAFINNRVSSLLGYTADDIEKMETIFPSLILHEDPRAFLQEMVVRYSHLKEDESEEFLINVRHKDNTERTFRNRMTVLQQDEAGKNYLILNVAEDITHVKRHEEELERQVEALNKSNRDLEQFAYVASHDLQEPLRKIIAFGERLSKKYTDLLGSEGQFFVERMTNAASRMHGLIEDLLVYSRASRQGETNTPISLNDIVKRVLEDLEIKIKEANAHIHLADLPTLEAQPTQMHQLFLNLIDNAIKFRKPNNEPTIKIEAHPTTPAEIKINKALHPQLAYYRITISDNGIGFAPEYAERIFAIFQRLHGRSEYEGTGLGLAICRKIAENHGGSIEAKAQEGEGAQFVIYLPTPS